jgi:GT2 family glycosyltransferase
VGFGEIDRGQFDQEKPCISCGGAMMVRRDLFEKLNGFDPIFNPYGPEDIDFSLRLQKAGYIALYIPKAVAYHAVNHTFGKGFTSTYARHKTRKWFLLMNRHASLWQRMFFMGLTAPWLFVKVAARESAKGNFSVLRGLAKGVLDLGKSKTSKQAADR